jgi:hypothetical protein
MRRTSDSVIEIENVGPIAELAIDLSSGPGVYELRGEQGAGKSHAIRAAEALTGRKVALSVRDGSVGGGVRGLGAEYRIGSRRPEGAIEMHAPEAIYDLGDLIDPPVKDPAAADARRIKALVQISGVPARREDYFDLVGGAEEFARLGVEPTDDPVLFCRRVRDQLYLAARGHETVAEHERGQAAACRRQAGDIEQLKGVPDLDQAHAQLEAAIGEARRLEQLAADAKATADASAKAQAELARLGQLPSVADAEAQLQAARQAVGTAETKLAGIREELARAESEVNAARAASRTAATALEHARGIRESVGRLQELARRTLASPPAEELVAAQRRVEAARCAVDEATRLRLLSQAAQEATEHERRAAAADADGARYRHLGRQAEGVLTTVIRVPGLSVGEHNGELRLLAEHPARGPIPFAELSDGERCLFAIRATARHLPNGQVLWPLSQRIWQELSPANRERVAAYAREHGIFIVTAQVSDGPLSVHHVDGAGAAGTEADPVAHVEAPPQAVAGDGGATTDAPTAPDRTPPTPPPDDEAAQAEAALASERLERLARIAQRAAACDYDSAEAAVIAWLRERGRGADDLADDGQFAAQMSYAGRVNWARRIGARV